VAKFVAELIDAEVGVVLLAACEDACVADDVCCVALTPLVAVAAVCACDALPVSHSNQQQHSL